MATIEAYEVAGGRRYRVRYRTPDRRQTDKRGFKTKRDAEAFAATVEVSKLRGEYIEPSDSQVTLGELGVEWLARQTHMKPSSYEAIESAWRVHVRPRWSAVRIADVKHTEVKQWIAELTGRRGATTVIRCFGVLAAILDDAVKDRRILSNPARGVKLPRKVRKEHNYLTHQQVHDLAGAAGKYGTLVLLLAYTGLRWGEATGLRVRDLDLLRSRVNVVQNAVTVRGRTVVGTPKTHERRSVPVPAFLVDLLARECADKGRDDLVFRAPKGGFLKQPNGTRGWFDAAWQAARLEKLTPHDLRHTAASLAVSAGANVKAVQRMLGHSSAAMTLDTYADLFDDDLNAVAMAMDNAARAQVVGKMWADGA